MSWDVKDLFTNKDVNLTIEFIINFIFDNENSQNIFPENVEFAKMKPENRREFLKSLRLKYNCFQTLNAFYQQQKAFSMGGNLSNLLS